MQSQFCKKKKKKTWHDSLNTKSWRQQNCIIIDNIQTLAKLIDEEIVTRLIYKLNLISSIIRNLISEMFQWLHDCRRAFRVRVINHNVTCHNTDKTDCLRMKTLCTNKFVVSCIIKTSSMTACSNPVTCLSRASRGTVKPRCSLFLLSWIKTKQ